MEGHDIYIDPKKGFFYLSINAKNGLQFGQIGKCVEILENGNLSLRFNNATDLPKGHKVPIISKLKKETVKKSTLYSDFMAIPRRHLTVVSRSQKP